MVVMAGTNDMQKQDSQLSLSWGRPHPLRPADDNDDKKGSTLSLQLSGRPKKMVQKMMNDKTKLVK